MGQGRVNQRWITAEVARFFVNDSEHGWHLNEGDDVAAGALVDGLIVPGGVLGDQPVAAAVVLTGKQDVQGQQTEVLVAADVCAQWTGRGVRERQRSQLLV